MDNLFLFASIANTYVAVRANEVEAVMRLADVTPVPLAPRHVCGLTALRSRVLTVIDMEARIFGAPPPDRVPRLAIVADIVAHSYAFLIDAVHDICPAPEGIRSVRGRISPAWAPFVGGLVDHGEHSHLLLTLSDFVAAPSGALAA